MTAQDIEQEKSRLVTLTMELIERRGAAIDRSILATEAGVSRARIEAIFPEDADLFDGIIEQWYAPDIAIMENVVASNLPIQRKFYEFYAQRFERDLARFQKDPATYALYVELGEAHFEHVRGYIDLGDHYLTVLIAQAQDEGYFAGLEIDRALTLINQMMVCYVSPQLMMILSERLAMDKLAAIVDTLFAGLSAEDGGAMGVNTLKIAT
ncbi:MAG: hypothetical protein ABJP34_04390 [Erythrobacter sp.]